MRQEQREGAVGSTECSGFAKMQRHCADRFTGVCQRQCQVGLHVGELGEPVVGAGIEPAKFFRRLNRDHLTFAQRMNYRDLGLQSEHSELCFKLRTDAARSQQPQLVALDGNEHTARGLDDGQTLCEECASDVFHRPSLGKRSRDVEKLARPVTHSLQLFLQFLQLGAGIIGANGFAGTSIGGDARHFGRMLLQLHPYPRL